jgi:hypothetical protein
VLDFALKISNDSFYTYMGLIYKNYVVAIACIVVAAKFLSLPSVMDQNFKNLENMRSFAEPPVEEEEFNSRLLSFENRSLNQSKDNISLNYGNNKSYFDILDWNKKIHPYMNVDDLLNCINMLYETYDDFMKYSMRNNIQK